MKIKIPKFGEIKLNDYNYYVLSTLKEIRLLDINNKFVANKDNEHVVLPKKYYIDLFLTPISQRKASAGVIVTPNRIKPI